jgi:4-diphosphocytidyl-2-C-methyl-D-erythritol kinase
MSSLRLEAPAKINLSLAVTARRDDGYHELRTEMALLELSDALLLMPGCAGLRVTALPGEEVPAHPADNLAWQGLLAGLDSEPLLACLLLDKVVPVAAGLGGGSSDAAAAWRLGRRSRGASESATEADLLALAAIGADVPFFASGAARAWVSGIGEVVAPLSVTPGAPHVVLVHPPFRLSTAAVFAELRPDEWSRADPAPGHNDLLGPAQRLRPELGAALRTVTAAGLAPSLTGSGPTLYALTDDPERADGVVRRLARAGLAARVTRLRTEPASIEVVADEVQEE